MSLAHSPADRPAIFPDHRADPAAASFAAVASLPPAPDAQRGRCSIDLSLRHAGRRHVALRYELLGRADAPVAVVAGGISAHRHVAASAAFPESGWWDAQIGPGRALDPGARRILAFDWLGADGTLDAPIDPADQADALAALLDALAIDRIEAFVGCSYGAMVGLQFAALHPARLGRLVAVSGSHRAHPWASAWRALQRRAVALGALQCDQVHGLELARQLAILGYRTPGEFEARFGGAQIADGRVRVAAEDYLDHCGAKYAAVTSPTAFLRLSESLDLQSLEPERIRVSTTVVAVADDLLVPVSDACALVERLRGPARLRVLRSLYGHDAFLKEHDAIAAVLHEALDGIAHDVSRLQAGVAA